MVFRGVTRSGGVSLRRGALELVMTCILREIPNRTGSTDRELPVLGVECRFHVQRRRWLDYQSIAAPGILIGH